MKIKRLKDLSHWQKLTPHPFSELTEFGVGLDAEALIGHMAQNGWDTGERITLYGGKILDGVHRHSCAQKAEVDPLFQEFNGTDSEALEFVRKKLLRQHLTTDQRAMIAAKLATLANGCRPSSFEEGEGSSKEEPSLTRAEAAKRCGTNKAALDRAKAVSEKCIPAIQRAYRTNEVSLTDAASVATLSQSHQEKALDAFRTGKVKTLAAYARKHKPQAQSGRARGKASAKAELKDETGRLVPDSCRDAFADPGLKALITEMKQAVGFIEADDWTTRATKLADHHGFILLEKFHKHAHDALESQQLAIEALTAGLPYAVCPKCDGAKENCRTCRGHGHIPEHRWTELQEEGK